ncbi:MAG TPA: hypothetical protein VK589_08620 [Chryseolinea sp.]|nr:hypothetical protein [Chryseolinea sp.]
MKILSWLTLLFLLAALIQCRTKTDAPAPILVLATDENYGSYTCEILRAEGFTSFVRDSITGSEINEAYLKSFDIVILAETSVTQKAADQLTDYVSNGGNLIAFRPDKKLSSLFGLTASDREIQDGYISIQSNGEIGMGLTKEPMQFHGEADQYTRVEGEEVATLHGTDSLSAKFPGVVFNAYGDGFAMAFVYNLPKSIVYTRQGNPEHAGREMDGITGVRAMDLFTGGFVDTSKNTINQADEQMRILTRGIEQMSQHKRPIPRLWYFPDTLKCLVTLNNDGEDSKEAEFNQQFEDVYAKGGRMTLYIKEVEFISKTWTDKWASRGFEISGHPDDTRQATNPDWRTMDSVYTALDTELKETYGVNVMKTVTNHWFVWTGSLADGTRDFTAQAKIEEKHGVGLDCNYAHYDNGSPDVHFLGTMGYDQGNYNGSGLSMKFADPNGKIVNVYQQLNNVYDQQYMEHKDQDGYFNAFKGLMDRSLQHGVYSTISVRAHNNEYFFSKVPLMKMLDYANERGVPVWTELKFLEFLRAKEETTISDITWADNQLSYILHSALPYENGITHLIPFAFNRKKIAEVSVNGNPYSYTVREIKGKDYALVTIRPGSQYSFVIRYVD